MNNKTGKETECCWINAFKGIAICAVVMVHNVGSGVPDKIDSIVAMGQYGVQMFFLISSYLTYVSLDKICINASRKIEFRRLLQWWKKKFFHLIPMYYLALVIYMICIGGMPYWLGTEGKVTVLNFVSHLFFVHGFVPHYVDSILGVEWYLGNLAIMYILMPLFYRMINNIEKSIGIFLGSLVLCKFVNSYAMNHWIPDVWDSYIYSNYFGNYFFIQQLPVILLGIVLYFFLQSKWLSETKSNKILSYELMIVSGLMLLGEMYDKNTMVLMSTYVRYAIWFCVLIISQSIYANRIINNRLFQKLGKQSYGVYLFHYLIIWIIEKYFIIDGENLMKWGIKYMIVLGISSLISVLWERVIKEISMKMDKIIL